MSAQHSRRSFLSRASGSLTAALAAGSWPVARGRQTSANERLRIAIIGTGGRGAANLKQVATEEITALCDVNDAHLRRAAEQYPSARRETDFRRLFDHADEFDAVVVSTTEHTHAFATLPALQLGKHVYCEKPLTHDVYEARVIRQAAAEAGVATQMGTQIHAGSNYRRVVELIQSGAIGPVRECHVWVGRAWGRQSKEEAEQHQDILHTLERPETADPIPPDLNWNLWLGPAPWRPFSHQYFPGPRWYRWWDFGNGTMSDLGSHWMDLPFWALDLDAPKTIEAHGPDPHPELAPASMQVTYEFAARGERPDVRVHWYQGTYRPPCWHNGDIPKWDSGALFVGDDGMVLSNYSRHVLLPEEKFRDFQPPEPWIPPSVGHHAEWILAAKTGSPTTCHFEYAGQLTETCHLGNVAHRVGQKLEWDAEAMNVTNVSSAGACLQREYRNGWTLR